MMYSAKEPDLDSTRKSLFPSSIKLKFRSSRSRGPLEETNNSSKRATVGVYFQATWVATPVNGPSSNLEKQDSSRSLRTVETHQSDCQRPGQVIWTSSGLPDHHAGSPLVARNTAMTLKCHHRIGRSGHDPILSDHEALGRILVRSRGLPRSNGIFASAHILINNDRTKRSIAPLARSRVLDDMARKHAQDMASENLLHHQDPEELWNKVSVGDYTDTTRIGENISQGWNVSRIHKTLITKSRSAKNNILDRRFALMGVGTAKADDGTLYLCQIFRD